MMLSDADLEALLAAKHADPFSVLGMHVYEHANERVKAHTIVRVNEPAHANQIWIRAFLPGAISVDCVEAASGQLLTKLKFRHPNGLFESCCVGLTSRVDYRLKVVWHDRQEGTYADAYSFGSQISDDDLRLLREGTHLRPYNVLGAHALEQNGVAGVRFALWAPNAKRVSVVGSFNSWDGRRHPMRLRHDAGVWEIFVPHATIGDYYKFEILSNKDVLLPLKADPYARAAQLRPDNASRVAALPAAVARQPSRAAVNTRSAPISIYEVHLSSWRKGQSGSFPSWDELATTLPAYAAEMGFTHIELLPVSEHPFDGSWGYQTLGIYAPTARFGPPEGFRRFVQACHATGVGLLLDWVPAHFPSDAFGMAQFDGTALYEYADPREGFHRDWNTLIYNFGRNEVRMFLASNALYWLECFGVDGLRVDAVASMLYRDYSRPANEWVPNADGGRENYEAISLLRRMNEIVGSEVPGTFTVAEESTAFPSVSAPTYAGGLGFHFKWNMGWMNDTLQYMHEDPVHRRWHHNKMTFGLVYAFSENFVLPISHDEVVHGKGSMLGKMPGDEWQRFANLRAYYGFMWGHPGKKLLFMGQEFAQPTEWNHDAELPWYLLDDVKHAGIQRYVCDLNMAYKKYPALHRLDCDGAGFEWLVADDADQSILAWMRHDGQGNSIIIVCNFTPVPRHSYRIGVPDKVPLWAEVLNSDAAHYGGSNVGNRGSTMMTERIPANGRERSINLTLPPLATLFLAPL